jgi:2-polyprenyl-6-methoxyphenol hydroxylase-like FAD-dependent oxidoreductase
VITDGDTVPVLRPFQPCRSGIGGIGCRGVTLLDDAAHLSAPNGEGANLAMYDGVGVLGQAIAEHPNDIEYEQAMFPRSAEVATEGAEVYEMLAGDNTTHSLIDVLVEDEQIPMSR